MKWAETSRKIYLHYTGDDGVVIRTVTGVSPSFPYEPSFFFWTASHRNQFILGDQLCLELTIQAAALICGNAQFL